MPGMDTSDWIAVAAVVVAVVAAGISAYAIRYARQSAVHAGASVVEARRSADEAAKMRELEADRREEERQRRHEDLGPDLPGEIVAEFRPHPTLGAGMGSLWGTVRFPRTCRVKAVARMGQSFSDLSVPMLVEAGQTVDLQIEMWHPEQERPKTDEVVFKVWPPVKGADDTPAWTCRCGRPTGEAMTGAGHWEQRVKVNYYDPLSSIA